MGLDFIALFISCLSYGAVRLSAAVNVMDQSLASLVLLSTGPLALGGDANGCVLVSDRVEAHSCYTVPSPSHTLLCAGQFGSILCKWTLRTLLSEPQIKDTTVGYRWLKLNFLIMYYKNI